MYILKKGHQPGVYVPLRALFLVVLHIYNKILGIRLAGHPVNKNKSLILIKF